MPLSYFEGEVQELPTMYACRKCGRKYSFEQYQDSRFCRDCETYLMEASKVSMALRKARKIVQPTVGSKVPDKWGLPEGYEVRKGQLEFVQDAFKAMKSSEIFVGSAPCGIGKSLASLLTVLPQLKRSKLVVTFRTRSQLHIYLKELRVLNCNFPVVSLYSKQIMCPMRLKGYLSHLDFYEECGRLKENSESSTKPYCRFYWKNINKKQEAEKLALECAQKIFAPEESVALMARRGFCAYEALKKILDRVDVFLGTYRYVFHPSIRNITLKSLGADLNDIYLIVDEAHNIPSFARELLSDKLAGTTVERALTETEKFDHELLPVVREYLTVLEEEVFQQGKKRLRKDDLRQLGPEKIDELFLLQSRVSGVEAAETIQEYGEYVKERRYQLGYERLFSYNYRVGEFLEGFLTNVGENYFHLIRRGWMDGVVLEVRGFDGREVTDSVLRQSRGSILMSGSLSPTNVYRDLILRDHNGVSLREFDSPFPPENRLILAADDVSSQFKKRTERMNEKWRQYIEAICDTNEGNVAFFFTSYALMQKVLPQIKTSRNLIVEERKTRRNDVVDALARSEDNALFGVMGGKLSEGIDYPHNLLTCVVAVGFPYATWNVYQKALINYYDRQFPEKGETYAYLVPAVLRLVQTSGRVHRSALDKGCIIILDERVNQARVRKRLPTYFQREMKIVSNSTDCAEQISSFWQKHRHLLV